MVANAPRGARIARSEQRAARYSPGRLTAYTSQADELASVFPSCRQDLDAVDLGVVLDGDELNGDHSRVARRDAELLDRRPLITLVRGTRDRSNSLPARVNLWCD
jgi:hypothetical protein